MAVTTETYRYIHTSTNTGHIHTQIHANTNTTHLLTYILAHTHTHKYMHTSTNAATTPKQPHPLYFFLLLERKTPKIKHIPGKTLPPKYTLPATLTVCLRAPMHVSVFTIYVSYASKYAYAYMYIDRQTLHGKI